MDDDLVVVHAFATGPEADLAKSALEGAGIDAIIQSDATGGVTPHLAFAGGGYKLLVHEEDAEDARDLLGVPDAER